MISPKICHCIHYRNMSKYVTVSTTNTWDTKYATVSNTWAIKDTVTSYFTNCTLCSVNFLDCKTQFVEFVFDKLYWKVELTCMGACGVTDEWSKFESFIKVTFKRVPPFCRQMHALYDVEAFFKQENIQFYGRRVLGIQT